MLIRDFPAKAHSSLLFMVLLMVLALASGCATSKVATPEEAAAIPLTAEQIQLNLESFDMVWQTIRDQHYDETLGGLDWQAIGDELRPEVAAAKTMGEARRPMQDLIGRLEQSHFVIYPADIYADAAGTRDPSVNFEDDQRTRNHSGLPGYSGLEVRVLGDEVLVTGVDANCPVAELGVVPGWEIQAIGSVEVAPRIEKLQKVLAGQTIAGLIISQSMEARLMGDEGDVLPVVFVDGQGQEKELEVVLGPVPGTPFTMGNLPEVRVWTRQEVLDGDIGYFRFNYFLDVMRVMGDFNAAMESFRELPGVVIDLRGNPGGLGAMAVGMAGWFVDERGLRLGTMTMRNGEYNFVINTRANGYEGELAVLIDEMSASTSEIFAGGLKDLDLARIFGQRTAGAALPSHITKLPNGDGFQYAIANYFSEGGAVLEGVGVEPHVEVIPTREKLLSEGDPILEAARKWLLENSQVKTED